MAGRSLFSLSRREIPKCPYFPSGFANGISVISRTPMVITSVRKGRGRCVSFRRKFTTIGVEKQGAGYSALTPERGCNFVITYASIQGASDYRERNGLAVCFIVPFIQSRAPDSLLRRFSTQSPLQGRKVAMLHISTC